MIRLLVLAFVVSHVVTLPASDGPESKSEPLPRYQLFKLTDDPNVASRLDRAVADGYRIIAASQGVLLMERAAETRQPTYFILPLANLEGRMGRAALRGYRLLPQALFGDSRGVVSAVMEKCAEPSQLRSHGSLASVPCQYEYLIVIETTGQAQRARRADSAPGLDEHGTDGTVAGYRLVDFMAVEWSHSATLYGSDEGQTYSYESTVQRATSLSVWEMRGSEGAFGRTEQASRSGFKLLATTGWRALHETLNGHSARGYRLRVASRDALVLEKASGAEGAASTSSWVRRGVPRSSGTSMRRPLVGFGSCRGLCSSGGNGSGGRLSLSTASARSWRSPPRSSRNLNTV